MAADCRISSNMTLEEERFSPPNKELRRRKQMPEANNVVHCPVERRQINSIQLKLTQSKLLNFRTLVAVSLIVLLVNGYNPVCSLSLDCDSVQKCICGRDDMNNGWRIECPNDNLLEYPITLQVQKVEYGSSNFTEASASLQVQCNSSNNKTDPWSYIKGMDLSADQVYAKIVKLEIRYCPPVKDGWVELFRKVNLSSLDIQRFTFITDDPTKKVQIPSNFFVNMPNIEHLVLRHNRLTSIPDLSSLKNLKSINLRNNDLESIPLGTFAQNTQLNSIALTNNKLKTISIGVFPESVEHLELNGNEISTLNSSTFGNLKNLKRLYLNGNRLDTLDSNAFDGMMSLEVLYLHNTMMYQFPNFRNLPKLTNLSISTAIQSKHIPGPDGTEITTTLAPDFLPENTLVLANLPSLEKVDLRLNHFTSLPVFKNLPKLVKIDLNRNDITEIESEAFKDLPSLTSLNLSRNRIRKVGPIRAISLSELDLSDNDLTELRNDTFRFVNTLKKLNLANNKIGVVTYKVFEPLTQLSELDLSRNQVTFNAPTFYAGNDTSQPDQYSFFDSNQSPLRYLFQLRKLNLAHNNIAKLGFSDWTQVFTQISEIDLRFNKIAHVTANELNFITQNLTLNLENNDISTIDLSWGWLLESNANDQKKIRIFLNGNPIKCDCFAYGLKKWESVSFEFRWKDLTCSSPEELKGKKLQDVSEERLICDLNSTVSGCPEPCKCRERPVDKTLIVDCSDRNLTWEDIPKLNTFNKVYSKHSLELDLSNNQIVDFNNTAYVKEFLNKTKLINLSGNSLTSTRFLERIPDYQTTSFALANNPFPCKNCVGFQIPWRAYPTRISDLANVTCIQESSEGFSSLLEHPKYDLVSVQDNSKEFENYCANASKLAVVVILPLVLAVIILSCLCIALFVTIRYGWAIKAYLYSKGWNWCLFWERDLDADEDADGNEKLYDAFISYSHKDEEWVLDELVKRLEDQEGFKLCLHFRDWTPGDWIPDQIVRSVDKSRRTVVVLSKNFVESVWSRLEFKAAHAQALKERSNRVILILLGEDLKECDVQDDDLKMYMKMNTFMKWNDPLFWHRLKYALPHRKPSNNSSSQQAEEDLKHNALNKMQQRDRAIKLDKLRAKLEQNV